MAHPPLRRLARPLAVALCLAWPHDLRAQGDGSQSDGPGAGFGFWIGIQRMPAGIDQPCSAVEPSDMAHAGWFLVLPAGPVSIEARAIRHWRDSPSACVLPAPLYELGTREERLPVLPSGGFGAIELRVRWMPARAWVVAAGGGWAGGSKDIPYLSSSVGVRNPAGTPRLGVALDLTAYRVPWIERTVETTESEQIETSRRRFEEWALAIGIRLTIEMPMLVAEN